MRRRFKLQYFVQDFGNRDHGRWWFQRGRWVRELEPNIAASNMVDCHTKRTALRYADALERAGGVPLISRRTLGQKKRWVDFWLPGSKGKRI